MISFFAANNLFTRMNLTQGMFANLLWFGWSEAMPFPKYGEAKSICLDCRLNRDFLYVAFSQNKSGFLKKMERL